MFVIGAPAVLLVLRHKGMGEVISHPTNPLNLISVFRLSVFIAGMLIAVALAKRYLGVEGVKFVSFFGGLFELHSVSLATATLYAQKKLTIGDAGFSLALALLATYTSKFILLWSLARNRFAILTSAYLGAMLMGGAAVFFLL